MANILINTLFNDVQKVTKKTSVNPSINTITSKQIITSKIPTKKIVNTITVPKEQMNFSGRTLNNNSAQAQNQRMSIEKNKLNIKKLNEANQLGKSKEKVVMKSKSHEKMDPIARELRSLNFDELQEKISKNPELRKKYEEILNSEETLIKKNENKVKSHEYRPSNSEEVKQIERINESNRKLEFNNKLNKKRGREKETASNFYFGNKISYNKSKVMYEEEYCQECLIYHKVGQHIDLKKRNENEKEKMNPDKKPTIQKTTQIFRKTKNDFKNSFLPMNKVQEHLIKQRNEKIYGQQKNCQQLLKDESTNHEKYKSNNNRTQSFVKKNYDRPLAQFNNKDNKNIQSKESFINVQRKRKFEDSHDDDLNDFIVNDSNKQNFLQKEMKKIKEKFKKGYYSPTDMMNESGSDIEEAGFDEIEREERYSEKIGEREDELEEIREKYLKNRKKKN